MREWGQGKERDESICEEKSKKRQREVQITQQTEGDKQREREGQVERETEREGER